jgi:outer membrane immunogenic protein
VGATLIGGIGPPARRRIVASAQQRSRKSHDRGGLPQFRNIARNKRDSNNNAFASEGHAMKKLLLAAIAAATLASGAKAADLGVPRMPIATAVVAPVFSWTGFYLGLNAGFGIANTNIGALTGGAVPGSGVGFIGGGQIGYNHQINNFVLGLEADLGYFGVSRSGLLAPGGPNLTWRTTWDASIRGRAGVAIDRTLLYVTGGLAIADLRLSFPPFGVLAVFPGQSETRVGWTVGAGIEHAITPNWTVRAEYLYANYGSKTYFAGAFGPVSLQTHKFRLGVNYLFSTGPSALVARY